ncbi:MAG: tRNA (adenosine(37)-N6)-threonylcarbamoyltransferase complex dimerization subunit type 1 TsaB [Acidobacteria bacterium]|nr:tRNA (adenosine(37)-N6)-threonylcarbamoyltransferase complex dimerization subunit type 1 TsaB [Acidobacteriota bacterium]
MRILAIDTTSEFGSLALARDTEIVDVISLHSREGFGHLIFQQIQALLDRHGLRLADVDGYAAASGPGSFTGVRVGLTAVKGLAEAHGKRVVPVSNLLALAFAGEGALRATVLDARRGEIYGAVYDAELRPVVEEVVTPWKRFLELLGDHKVTFVATDFTPFRASLAGTRFEDAPVVTISRALAGAVAGVAARAFSEGRALLPEQVDANYVRRSDAELMWKESR